MFAKTKLRFWRWVHRRAWDLLSLSLRKEKGLLKIEKTYTNSTGRYARPRRDSRRWWNPNWSSEDQEDLWW